MSEHSYHAVLHTFSNTVREVMTERSLSDDDDACTAMFFCGPSCEYHVHVSNSAKQAIAIAMTIPSLATYQYCVNVSSRESVFSVLSRCLPACFLASLACHWRCKAQQFQPMIASTQPDRSGPRRGYQPAWDVCVWWYKYLRYLR